MPTFENERFFQDKQYPALPLGMLHSIGFGVRWFSPIGPLRFEWASRSRPGRKMGRMILSSPSATSSRGRGRELAPSLTPPHRLRLLPIAKRGGG